MNVVQVSTFDSVYGAAIAAKRISDAVNHAGISSRMLVRRKKDADPYVEELKSENGPPEWRTKINGILRKIQAPRINGMYSPSVLATRHAPELDDQADIINLHWINYDFLSIEDIGQITKPIVWTLHDMWPFLGCEHYIELRTVEPRKQRYSIGLDLSRWVTKRKIASWKQNINFVGPSHWIADCARKSQIGALHRVNVIPNPINTDLWCPLDRNECRRILGLDPNIPVVGFGAFRADLDLRKGGDLLNDALQKLHSEHVQFQALVFGNSSDAAKGTIYPTKYLGTLNNIDHLRVAYSAMSVMVIPSRIDNLPNTGLEAGACGVPVVAFDVGGLRDIVEHGINGRLAKPYDTTCLSNNIRLYIELSGGEEINVSSMCRYSTVKRFGHLTVGKQYIDLYNMIREESKEISRARS